MSVLKMRAGQRRFLHLVDEHRILAFLARRQYGKTTTFAKVALRKMMKQRDHTVIFGSAKLNLSREIVLKESGILRAAIQQAAAQSAQLKVADAGAARVPDALSPDDFAALFEAQRLEFRFYHSPASYSRTKVVALRPDTVGETGDLMCDEIGRVGNWREVWEAVKPIISSNPQFRICLSTTIPPDDTHYSYEQLIPPTGTLFTPHPAGNEYRSDAGIHTLRVDAWDAYADGIPLYDDDTGEPLSPEESRARDRDKDAWDRNYGLKFLIGGIGACGILQLDSAQSRGIGKCACILIESDSDFDRALVFLHEHLGAGPVGLGIDLATTTKQTSNPTAVAVAERRGIETVFPAVLVWKTGNEQLARERFRRVVQAIPLRPEGGPARRLAIDATNERYFADALRREFLPLLPVLCMVGSEATNLPGKEPMNWKQHLGSVLVGELDDNHLTLPPERYLREDWRLVKKERGAFVCEPDVDGKHGDTFDACKLALHALSHGGGAVEATAVRVGGDPLAGHAGERFPLRPDHTSDGVKSVGVGMP